MWLLLPKLLFQQYHLSVYYIFYYMFVNHLKSYDVFEVAKQFDESWIKYRSNIVFFERVFHSWSQITILIISFHSQFRKVCLSYSQSFMTLILPSHTLFQCFVHKNFSSKSIPATLCDVLIIFISSENLN